MDRTVFHDTVRKDPRLFGGALSPAQVEGMNGILDEAASQSLTAARLAYVLATAHHETARHMAPIKETVMPHHKNKNPSDATVIARLESAWKAGRLRNVRTPYWREGWFGRGQVQLTHRDNYERMGKVIGVDLVANPDLMLDPKISAKVLITGMMRGLFRAGHSLPRYFSETVNEPVRARAIVNGPEYGPGEARNPQGITNVARQIALVHNGFLEALTVARWNPDAAPVQPAPVPATTSSSLIARLLQALLQIFRSR